MKKKLFSILVTLAMVVAMMPMMTMTAFGGTCNTIGDVLNTVAFPTSESWSTSPYDAWINDDSGMTCYKTDTQFIFKGNSAEELNTPVVADGQNYKYEFKWQEQTFYTITFNIENGILKSITIYSSQEDYKEANGEYKPRVESNWFLLAKAMAGENQTTLDNVFTVSDDAQSGVRTITMRTDITAGTTDSALCVPAGKKIVLDLNGHKLDRGLINASGAIMKKYGSVIEVEQYGELTINDKNGAGGIITGGTGYKGNSSTYGGGVYNDGSFIMNAGTISGNKAKYGGGVYNYDTFNMNAGTISGNEAAYGGGVYNYGYSYYEYYATFTMNDGYITSNKATGDDSEGGGVDNYGIFNMKAGTINYNEATTYGGGVCNLSIFTMEGGKITENTATVEESEGGGVDNYGTFNMNAGTISGNEAAAGGGVFAHNGGTHTFGGAAVVRENKSTDTTEGIDESNVHLHYNEDSKAQAKVSLSTEKPLSNGAEIGLTVWKGKSDEWGPGKPVEDFFAADALTENNMKYFFMNDCAKYEQSPDYQGIIYSIEKQESKYVLSGTYKVEINATENGTVTADKSYYPDEEIVTLTVTPDEGYELKSLKYNDGNDHVITDEGSGYKFTMPKANVTVKAEFQELTAALTYDANGHGKAPREVTMKYFEETKAATELKADGYTFVEWNTKSDGSGTSYAPGATVKAKDAKPSKTTLFAIWKLAKPEITKGDNQTVKAGAKEGVTVTSNAPFDTFKKVLVDGKEITKDKDYTVKEGSTIVTLKPEYVSTLKAGKYKVEIVSEGGTATATLTITEADSPKTGDSNNMLLWSLLLALSIIGLGLGAYYKSVQREE